MPRRKKESATDEVPDAMRELVERFIDGVNDNRRLILLLKQFEAANRERAAAHNAEARHVSEMHEEEQQLMSRLTELRSHIKAASAKSAPASKPS